MSYRVTLHPRVAKFIARAEPKLRERIQKRLLLAAEDPHRHLETLAGQDLRKLRIGTYRALIDLDEEAHILWVRHLDHRKRIYRRD